MAPLGETEITTLIRATFDRARAMNLGPMAACVVDAGGAVVGFLREDGAPMIRFEVARAKAWSAVARGVGTSRLAEMAARNPVLAQSLQAITPHFMPVRGGVLLCNRDGALVGALGVTGASAEEDEAAALAGAEAAGLIAEP